MTRTYVPALGDVVWLQFDPQAGHEQAGHRPALVLTPANYNRATGTMICCPMTSRIKGFPYEVVVSDMPPSVVLADQVKSVDWIARGATRKGTIPPAILEDVRAMLKPLLGL